MNKTIGRTKLPSTGKGTGYLPDIPNSNQDRRLSMKLGDAINAMAPENPSLDPRFFPRIRDQLQLGGCVGQGVRNGLMYHLMKRDRSTWTKHDLSPLALYYWARTFINMTSVDSGAYIRDGIKGAAKYGGPKEDYYPYDISRFTRKPGLAAQLSGKWHQAVHYYRCDEIGQSGQAVVDNILRAIQAGLPVVFGFTCYDNIANADATGYIPTPIKGSKQEGGHCMCIYGADTNRRVFFGPNSWSNQWGAKLPGTSERGYFFLPFDFFLNGDADDAWAVDHE